MRAVRTFAVAPSLPPRLEPLRELAFNLRWSWDPNTTEVFRRLDADLFEACGYNPVRMLGLIPQERLAEAAKDDSFLAHMHQAWHGLDTYMASRQTWFHRLRHETSPSYVAYFSAEFGLANCLPLYAGGLGILAGDHLKAASGLGIPIIGVGLLYQQGQFQQYLNADGWQGERYLPNDFSTFPIRLQERADGSPLTIEVAYPERPVRAQIWLAQVGRERLALLDANLPTNHPADREITGQLYGGDKDMRIRQEILLGIGGLRALDALGIRPAICHMNEGHAAFVGLERIRQLMQDQGLSFTEAYEAAASGNIFTTHTPVPAGIDVFPIPLMDRYFSSYYPTLGLNRRDFLALGREQANDDGEGFSMAVLAIRLSARVNGVSKLHGKVCRRMWANVWPNVPEDEVPITSVTNGAHTRSWISAEMRGLYDRYLGPRWQDEPDDQSIWARVADIPHEELWRTHERRRERLVAFARRRLHGQYEQRGLPQHVIDQASEALDPDALTIGFARRFTAYKRATLLLRDKERLARILCDRKRPVQIIYAGKAHPQDDGGKELIRQLVHFSRQDEFRRHIVFLENYDITVARYLVQGVDVWLNNPRRFEEASGTSGMKAAVNGALNLSVLDGWWDEAYRVGTGWAIGRGEEYEDHDYQDAVESEAIYDLLEREIVPMFYDRSGDGLPREWTARMKASMSAFCPIFNAYRMVTEYTENYYIPAMQRCSSLSANAFERAKALAAWKETLASQWSRVRIESSSCDLSAPLSVGDALVVTSRVHLGELKPEDVAVELYYGRADAREQITGASLASMKCIEQNGNGLFTFSGSIPCRVSGQHGYSIRVRPYHADMNRTFEPGFIVWE